MCIARVCSVVFIEAFVREGDHGGVVKRVMSWLLGGEGEWKRGILKVEWSRYLMETHPLAPISEAATRTERTVTILSHVCR